LLEGLQDYRVAFPALDPIARADFDGDFTITPADTAGFIDALLVQ
jgi:hypothetical protein